MDKKYDALFTPWKIGNCEIKNRIVLTSMGGTDLFGWMEINHFYKAIVQTSDYKQVDNLEALNHNCF